MGIPPIGRRIFLRSAAAAAAGIVLDPELALWVPGRKTIFLPSVAPVSIPFPNYGNRIVTMDEIIADMVAFMRDASRELANRHYDINGAEIGTVVNTRKPAHLNTQGQF